MMRERTGSAMRAAFLAGVLSALTWLPALAQQADDADTPEAARYFQFEVLVFRNLDSAAQHEEKWPTERDLKRPDNAIDLDELVAQAEADQAQAANGGASTTAGNGGPAAPAARGYPGPAAPTVPTAADGGAQSPALAAKSQAASTASAESNPAEALAKPAQPLPAIAPVPADERKLNDVRRRLERNGRYDILYYQAWRQPLTEDDPGIPYRITGGIRYGDDYELDGYLTFSLRRYLHLDADLWLTDFVTGTNTDTGGWSLSKQEGGGDGWRLGSDSGDLKVRSQYYDMLSERHLVVQAVHLDERRRMRSGQLNYLDQPLFGVLVLITPVQPPPPPDTTAPDATGAQPAPIPAGQAPASAPSE